jgi:hypothetical protein
MSKQTINLGTVPTGAGGDTPRSAFTKTQSNIDELYAAFGATGSPQALPAALPVALGGTGNSTGTAQKLFGAGMVGAVSQSGGVATGAVMESGTNAAGSYIRYADGTQICYKRVSLGGVAIGSPAGSVFYSTVVNPGAFAATFVGLPTTEVVVQSSSGLCWNTVAADPTTLQFGSIFIISPTSTSVTIILNCLAIGRWF